MPDSTVTATATPTTVAPTNGFTSEPIKVAETVVSDPPAQTTTAPIEPKPDVISALAKANQEARLTKRAVEERNVKIAELTKELEAARELGGRTSALEKELADIYARPSLLMKKGKTFEEILNDLGRADEEPADPRLVAIEAKLAEQEKAAKEAAERAEKDKTERQQREEIEMNARARANVTELIKEEGVKPDATGNERWALVSMDDTAVDRAILEVRKYIAEKEPQAGSDRARELVCSALDQMETVAREETTQRAAKLKLQPNRRIDDGLSFSKPPSQDVTRDQLRPTPGIDANVRGNPLPPPGVKTTHGFTGLLR